MAYTYADSRAKHIDLQIKSDRVYNRRVLCPHNTDNLHEIKVINSLVTLNKEGVVRVQHPTDFPVKLKNLYRNKLKESFEDAANIREGYLGMQRNL